MPSLTRRREERLEVRLSAEDKHLLQVAAAAQNKNISAFVLESGVAAATEALADRTKFVVSTEAYDAFVAALEAPVKLNPRLDRLLDSPSVIE